jgi:putative membrane protein
MTPLTKACVLAIACSLSPLGCSSSAPSNNQAPAASTGSEAPPSVPATAPASSSAPNPTAGPQSGPGPGFAIQGDAQVLQILSDVDTAEIDQAQIAQRMAGQARVQQFAAQMIKDHSAAKDKTAQLAATLGVTPQPSGTSRRLQAKAQQTSETLKNMPPSSFDQTYIQAQLDQHREVLTTIGEQLMTTAQSDAVRAQLDETQRLVSHHIEMASQIQHEIAPR